MVWMFSRGMGTLEKSFSLLSRKLESSWSRGTRRSSAKKTSLLTAAWTDYVMCAASARTPCPSCYPARKASPFVPLDLVVVDEVLCQRGSKRSARDGQLECTSLRYCIVLRRDDKVCKGYRDLVCCLELVEHRWGWAETARKQDQLLKPSQHVQHFHRASCNSAWPPRHCISLHRAPPCFSQ